MELVQGKYLEYRDRPLVREGNTICYGDKTEKCFLLLDIMSYYTDAATGEELPEKIIIQIIDSNNPDNIIKQGEQIGLYNAFSLGTLWLERELNSK